MWDECNCAVVWAFFGIRMRTDLFQSCGYCWAFQICWHIECSTFTVRCLRSIKHNRHTPHCMIWFSAHVSKRSHYYCIRDQASPRLGTMTKKWSFFEKKWSNLVETSPERGGLEFCLQGPQLALRKFPSEKKLRSSWNTNDTQILPIYP